MHTLYIDKPMKGHNLMQAIAGVNRVFKDKQGGLVVDCIGIANELKSALKVYTDSKGRGRPTLDAHEAYSVLAEKLDALRGMLAGTDGNGFDYSGFLTDGHKVLAGAANHVLGLVDGKRRLADLAVGLSKAFSLYCTLAEAKAVREQVSFLQAVKVILTKREISQQKKTDEARELAENLRKNLSVDGSARESVQAKPRLMVKRILRKYKYPPDQQDAAAELVLSQAKVLGEEWL